ncbi:MAG: rpsF [Candidatus Aminicenantes bacterium]|nr:rpsF [Candidatus Aminicenantes bacterium]
MKIYETGFLLTPNLSEDDTDKLINQMADVISQREGRLIRQERWGKHRMAYSIKRWSEAFYVFFHYEGKPDIPLELERRFKQTDSVLRYLTLQKEARDATRRKRKKSAAAEPKEAPPEAAAEPRPAAQEPGQEVK